MSVPTVTSDGVELYYERDGDDGTAVVFVEEAGLGAWLWGWQAPAVAREWTTVVWDLRGTGRSDGPAGPYEVATLAGDLEAVLAAADVERAHLVGAGLGGMVALAHARRYDRARSLALFGTAASGEAVGDVDSMYAPPDDPEALRATLASLFSDDPPAETVADIVGWRRTDDADPEGWRAQAAAVAAFDATDWLYEVTAPALVCHGIDDRLVPTAAGRRLAEGLPRGEFRAVAGGHLCFVERSRAVTDELLAFWERERNGF